MSDDHVFDDTNPSMPDAMKLDRAYGALIERLTMAAKEYREASTPEAQRSASQGFMVAVMVFLDRTGAPSNLRPPLFDLCLALDELGNGATEPLLNRKRIGHRTKTTLKEKKIRAQISCACHVLLKSGLSLDEAARYCARKVGGTITHEQVKDWREQAASGLVSEDLASRLYQRYAEQIDNAPQMPPGEARRIADQFLEAVRVELTRRNPK
jgi:hypothetical protein